MVGSCSVGVVADAGVVVDDMVAFAMEEDNLYSWAEDSLAVPLVANLMDGSCHDRRDHHDRLYCYCYHDLLLGHDIHHGRVSENSRNRLVY